MERGHLQHYFEDRHFENLSRWELGRLAEERARETCIHRKERYHEISQPLKMCIYLFRVQRREGRIRTQAAVGDGCRCRGRITPYCCQGLLGLRHVTRREIIGEKKWPEGQAESSRKLSATTLRHHPRLITLPAQDTTLSRFLPYGLCRGQDTPGVSCIPTYTSYGRRERAPPAGGCGYAETSSQSSHGFRSPTIFIAEDLA